MRIAPVNRGYTQQTLGLIIPGANTNLDVLGLAIRVVRKASNGRKETERSKNL